MSKRILEEINHYEWRSRSYTTGIPHCEMHQHSCNCIQSQMEFWTDSKMGVGE